MRSRGNLKRMKRKDFEDSVCFSLRRRGLSKKRSSADVMNSLRVGSFPQEEMMKIEIKMNRRLTKSKRLWSSETRRKTKRKKPSKKIFRRNPRLKMRKL